MKNFKWSKDAFKNGFSVFLVLLCFGYMVYHKESSGEMLIIITWIVKHYYDSNKESQKKDETINTMANSIPDAVNKKQV